MNYVHHSTVFALGYSSNHGKSNYIAYIQTRIWTQNLPDTNQEC
jgi:hypothetical protein